MSCQLAISRKLYIKQWIEVDHTLLKPVGI